MAGWVGGWVAGWVAGLLENKANLNSSFSLVEVEVWVELGNISIISEFCRKYFQIQILHCMKINSKQIYLCDFSGCTCLKVWCWKVQDEQKAIPALMDYLRPSECKINPCLGAIFF